MSEVSELNLKLLRRAPFLATVALHAEVLLQERSDVAVAATDGKRIFLSPARFMARPLSERLFIYAHEVLHCALSHPSRRGWREPRLWNVAADLVVNGLLAQSGLEPPEDALRDHSLERLSAEEVYEQLLSKPHLRFALAERDVFTAAEGAAEAGPSRGLWRNVLRRAATLARMVGAGATALGGELEVALGRAQVNWREVLLRFLVSGEEDYGGFDTRLIHRGLYLEALESRGLTAAVHIDTSGSLNDPESQGQFLAELKGILNAYPSVRVRLSYGDTALYGPFDLAQDTAIPPPQGGGGTSFLPFFAHAAELEPALPLIVFTDGYGVFPAACDHPCLWVVTEGGLPSPDFPFGEVVRLAR